MISEELERYINELKERYSDNRLIIMPSLRYAQERFGKVDDEVVEVISHRLNIPAIKILSTARFYHFFTEKIVAKYRIEVCSSISCSLLGSEHVYEYLKRRFKDIKEENLVSVERVGCLGSCGTAPAMLINNTLFEDLTYEKLDKIIEGIKSGKDIDKILE